MKKILLTFLLLPMLDTMAQNCLPATGQINLDINNVSATILGGADMWWNQATGLASYEVPNGSGHNAMYASSLWLGGIDAGGKIHVAAQTYRQTGNDFWPGPIEQNGLTSATTCGLYDRQWKVTKADIQAHISNPTNPQLSISTWPSKGNNINGVIITNDMAPFVDVNNNGVYDPTNGDYPKINGDMAIWLVVNDIGDTHTESKARQLGVEVQIMAYAYLTNDVLNNTTFYNYNIVNKSDTAYSNFYIGIWTDSDLGGAFDDFIGFDSTRNAAIFYNETANDAVYGTNIPVAAIAAVSTPTENGVPVKMKYGGYFQNNASPQGNPFNGADYYNYLNGKFKDSTSWGYNYAYPGSPCNTNEHSMVHPTLQFPGDYRTVQSFGPMNLQMNECKNITTAVVTTFNTAYPNPCFANIQASIDSVKMLHASLATNTIGCSFTGIEKLSSNSTDYSLSPNPANNEFTIATNNKFATQFSIVAVDGSIILNGKLYNQKTTIKLNDVSNGIYFIEIKNNEGAIFATKKLIKN